MWPAATLSVTSGGSRELMSLAQVLWQQSFLLGVFRKFTIEWVFKKIIVQVYCNFKIKPIKV